MAAGEGSGSGTSNGSDEPRQDPPASGARAANSEATTRDESGDELLLKAVARGDRDALGALYDRFAGEMLAVGQRFLGGPREAEDLVHDVFLEAWHRAGHYDRARGSVRTWLMMRLRSLVGFEETKSELAANDEPEPTWPRGRVLYGELAGLPAEQRAVIELGYFAGYSHAEIALELEIPLGTVKSRISRAISTLRSRLDPSEEQP
jgi:RNA polymerase sigma-70 factor (ECF subfamily)